MDYFHARKTALILVTVSFLVSCRMGDGTYMSEEQQQEVEQMYNALQKNHRALMAASEADSLPDQLKNMYAQMQTMHQQMENTHRQMMSRNMDQHMQDGRMMSGGMGMHMQSHMSGEWYSQMIGMHKEMARIHREMGQDSLAEMNQRLSREFDDLRSMIPGLDRPTEVPFNAQGDPDLLNGERLYARNCASCHGENGQGMSGVFPPLVNTNWVTASKSIPIRILLHGLEGSIEVNGQAYNGQMPSFKARLSAAEIAAILNYLRDESDDDLPRISQQDVINVAKANSERVTSWQAQELQQGN